jgi:hypothetical protein
LLLTYSGLEARIKDSYFMDWNNVSQWNPEMRYGPVGKITLTEAYDVIASTKNLLKII